MSAHDKIIKRLFPTHTYEQIAEAIGCSKQKVANRGYKLGLRRNMPDYSIYDALILRLAKTHTYGQITKIINDPEWKQKRVQSRGYKLGVRRNGQSVRDQIPVPTRLATPDDGPVAELVEKWI